MAQNVLVCCRFRPPSAKEIEEDSEKIIEVLEDHKTCKILMPGTSKPKSFNFDYVFDCNASQVDVFMHTAQPMVKEIMAGFNTTIFAYGQTGSGKTFTMMGDRTTETGKGIIPRLVEAVFEAISDADEDIEFTIKLSYLEIYNERLKDLLNPEQDNLKIRESTSAGVWVQDLTESYISSYEEVLEVMAIGEKQRSIAATKMNMESSRSHSVFILTLGQLHQKTGSRRGSKLTLVDLAGSEKVQKTGAEGQTLKEAQHINKSLSALGLVIKALTSKSKHIPYRDSKLTRLLSDSLGGNSKTCLIIACSPGSSNSEETLSTLGFGSRAKKIKNKPTVNQEKSVAEYKRLLAAAEATIRQQAALIKALEEDVEALRNTIASSSLTVPALKSPSVRETVKSLPLRPEERSDPSLTDSLVPQDMESISELDDQDSYQEPSEEPDEIEESEDSELKVAPATPGAKSPKSKKDDESSPSSRTGQIEIKKTKREHKEDIMNGVEGDLERLQDGEKAALEDKQEIILLQKKLALMEKEHALQVEQLKEEIFNLRKQPPQSVSSASLDSTKSPGASSPPISPHRGSVSEGVPPSIFSGLLGTGGDQRQLLEVQGELKRLRTMNEAMTKGLKKKCDQYMHLQIIHQDTKEILNNMEQSLAAAQKKLSDGAAQKKIKDLELRLAKSEEICQKLFESGMYWRGKRSDKSAKIRVPIKGGGKKNRKKKPIGGEDLFAPHRMQAKGDKTLERGSSASALLSSPHTTPVSISSSSPSSSPSLSSTSVVSTMDDLDLGSAEKRPGGKIRAGRITTAGPATGLERYF